MTAPALADARCELPLGVHAVGAARNFVDRTLAEWDTDTESIATARLLASELVTNAVLYGYGARELRLRLNDTDLKIMVFDDAPGHPQARTPNGESEIGRGMQVIEACATRWGVDPDGAGKVVWCELPLTTAAAAPAPAAGQAPSPAVSQRSRLSPSQDQEA
jgi:anti-sigma regulatory factor (Ser/Thr protein kinase)